MKRFTAIFLATLILSGVAGAYTIDLTLYNTGPLLNNNGVTPLQGTTSGGNFVQLVLAGNDGADAPDIYGNPSGNDTLLATTYVGAGLPGNPNQGLLEQAGIFFDNSLVSSNVYVRFWNANTRPAATYYGNSAIFVLPDGDLFGQAVLDFVPNTGYARITDTPFAAEFQAIPEPSHLFAIGLLLLAGWWFVARRRSRAVVTVAVIFAATMSNVNAQSLRRFDIAASRPIRNADNSLLPGNNPNSADFGFSVTAGTLIQILNVGPNGVADLPNNDGSPGGDDSVVTTTTIGQGIAPDLAVSGQFSLSLYPSLTDGTKVYARAFNAPTIASATHWGQSATFTVAGVAVMDVSALGLTATSMPKGVDLNSLSPKGLTYQQELIAGTNPNDPNDLFQVSAVTPAASGSGVSLNVRGHAGRSYILQRTTDTLGAGAQWDDVQTVAPLSADTNLILQDPAPPDTDRAFYRIRVVMP